MCVCVCVFYQTAAAGPALSGQFPAGAAAPQPTEAAHAGAPAARSQHAQPASPGQSLLHTVLFNFKPDDCLNVSSALPTSRMEALTLLSLLSCKKYCFYYSKINHYRYIWIHFNYMPELYFSDMLSSCDRCRFKSIPFYDFNTFFCLKILVIYPLSVLKLVEKTAQILSLQKSWFYETHQI